MNRLEGNSIEGKKPLYVIVVDDQQSYAERPILRLRRRGIPEDHIIWFQDAEKALNFVTYAPRNTILGAFCDYLNGNISETTGAAIVAKTRELHPDAIAVIASSKDRAAEKDVVEHNLQECCLRKHQHKTLAVRFFNLVRDSGKIALIPQPALEQFQAEAAINRTLENDLRAIIHEAFGDKPFDDLIAIPGIKVLVDI